MQVLFKRFGGWRSLALTVVMLIVAGMLVLMPGKARAATVSNDIHVPISGTVQYAACGGEPVALSGDAHMLIHVTQDASGGAHGDVHTNYQGVSGIGQTTGTQYHLSSGQHSTFNTSGLPFEDTEIQSIRIIGQGPDNNTVLQMVFHITINAQGEVTAVSFNMIAQCH